MCKHLQSFFEFVFASTDKTEESVATSAEGESFALEVCVNQSRIENKVAKVAIR
jgi:hypothetical protein